MTQTEIHSILSRKGLALMGGEIIHPTRTIDRDSKLVELEHSIIQSIKHRGAGGKELSSLGIQFLLGMGVGSIFVVKDPKRYLAFGVVHPDSNYEQGKLVISQIGKQVGGQFWVPDHLNPAKPDQLNLEELISTCSAISQLATVGDHAKPGFAGVADPRHLSSAMSTVIPGSRASELVGSSSVDRQVHIADDWEQSRSMISIITNNSPNDVALIPIPMTVRDPIYEAKPQPDIAFIFPDYLVDLNRLDQESVLCPLSATKEGALELLQAMAYHQVVKHHAGDGFSHIVDSHR